jgi:phage terminase large subunit
MEDLASLSAAALAPKVRDLFFDAAGNWIPSDYKVMRGGRAGLKTWGFARVALLLASVRKVRIACAREYQTSIQESVHQTLSSQIEQLGLSRYFRVQKTAIHGYNESYFFFAGIKTEPRKFKSTEDIDILWIEEGESVTKDSWAVVDPTIRTGFSEIWCGFNPDLEGDETSQRFIEHPIPSARIIETNWRDNPWLSDRLRRQKDYLATVDPDAYAHVWEGGYRQNSEAQILAKKYTIQAFEPVITAAGGVTVWDGPYLGADWGFARDPSTLVKLWVFQRKLFIEHEAYGIGVDIDKTADLFDRVPRARDYAIRADNARPETISYMQRHGYPRCVGVDKWPGSVEDGIAFLRGFEQIVIHPRCTHAIEEAKLYSYKTDKNSGDVLPDIVDAHNHIWDAVRYALAPLIKRTGFGFVDFANDELARMEAEKRQAEEDTKRGR